MLNMFDRRELDQHEDENDADNNDRDSGTNADENFLKSLSPLDLHFQSEERSANAFRVEVTCRILLWAR